MNNKRTIIVGAACALAGAATTASANVSHIFGPGGPVPTLDAQCHRSAPTHWKAGPTLTTLRRFTKKTDSIMGNQIHCLIRRKDETRACVAGLGPVPPVVEKSDHGVGKPGDEIGAAAMQRYLVGLTLCLGGGSQ